MPITSVGSWLPTIDEFLTHWEDANTAIAPDAITLSGAYDRAALDADRGAVESAVNAVQDELNVLSNARGDRDVKRAGLRPRLLQFGPVVRGYLQGSKYVKSIPRTPPFRASAGAWRDAMEDVSNLWLTINANSPAIPGFVPPLKLAAGYTILLYGPERSALSNAFEQVNIEEQDLQLARETRDAVFKPVYNRLVQYRQVIQGRFAEGTPIFESLPRLTPPAGATPDPVNLSGIWSVPDLSAKLTYTESDNPNLAEYELRACFGDRYRTVDEEVIKNNGPGELEFITNQGLVASGSRAFYRVYVKLTTGNEKGSNTVSVTRP